MNADRRMAISQTLYESAILAPRIFICMRFGLAALLQAFSLALLCILVLVICETLDFYPFFRISLKLFPRKKEATTPIAPSPLVEQTKVCPCQIVGQIVDG